MTGKLSREATLMSTEVLTGGTAGLVFFLALSQADIGGLGDGG
jgi:hypothetical protein